MDEEKFSYGNAVIVGISITGDDIINSMYNSFLPLILLSDVFGLGPALAFFTITWDNIIKIFVSPWAGAKSTWNRFGRRKGWVILGGLMAAAVSVMVPRANTLIVLMVYIIIYNLGLALISSTAGAWLGDLFTPAHRSKANGIIQIFVGFAEVIALYGGGRIYAQMGPAAPFDVGAALLIISLAIPVLLLKEPEQIEAIQTSDQKKPGVLSIIRSMFSGENRSGGYVWLGLFSWAMAILSAGVALVPYSVRTLGLTPGQAVSTSALYSVATILFSYPSGLIANRIGRKNAIDIGTIGMILSTGGAYFVINSQSSLGVIYVICGIFFSLLLVNYRPLFYDYADQAQIGAYTGVFDISVHLAAVVGPVLTGFVIESFGDDFGLVWPIMAVFMGLSWLAMRGVKEKVIQTPA
ncbi:MAG: MFS transporter [Planctomycetota bacterium]